MNNGGVGGYSEYILLGVCTSKKGGGLRCRHNPKGGGS